MDMEELVQKLLSEIASGSMTQPRLIALFQNAQRNARVTDEQKERLAVAIEAELRERFPRSAKSMFGPADGHARHLLDGVQKEVGAAIDLSRNRVLNRVKTGGDMIAGRYHLDVYVSYKNQNGQRLSLDIRQQTPLDRPTARVQLVQVGGENAGPLYEQSYEMDQFDAAGEDYKLKVVQVAASG